MLRIYYRFDTMSERDTTTYQAWIEHLAEVFPELDIHQTPRHRYQGNHTRRVPGQDLVVQEVVHVPALGAVIYALQERKGRGGRNDRSGAVWSFTRPEVQLVATASLPAMARILKDTR